MGSVALHSDHINYLILRYLQETGHETAATAFYRDWRRPRDFRDPESFPFAGTVGRNELISVIQEGLRHDELISRVARAQRRFRWISQNTDNDGLPNGVSGSRPSSSGKRKGRPVVMRAPDEFPTPVAKRQRRSEGPEGPHINGDREAMEVDVCSASPDVEEDGEQGSPEVGSEADAVDFLERYDSVATQTEGRPLPKLSTIYWTLDKPEATVLHSMWCPDPSVRNNRTLLTVGDSLCRFYDVPESLDAPTEIPHVDYPQFARNYVVTASAWHPDGSAATCAVDTFVETPDGQEIPQQRIINHSRDHGSVTYADGPQMLHGTGIVLCLKYSPDGNFLLVARTSLDRGSIQIWEAPRPEMGDDKVPLTQEPIAWRIFEHQIMDACWTDDNSFLVCGKEGLASLYQLRFNKSDQNGSVDEVAAIRGVVEIQNEIVVYDRLDKVRYDHSSDIVVFVSVDTSKLLTKRLTQVPGSAHDTTSTLDLPTNVTALAFQPNSDRHTENAATFAHTSSCLAVAFEDGSCVLYRISHSETTTPEPAVLTCRQNATLRLSTGPALAVAWSPSGSYLAVGGTELIQIWKMDVVQRTDSIAVHKPYMTWHPDSVITEDETTNNGIINGGAEHDHLAPSLSWRADGENLAFTMDKQIAIIRFTPSLTSPEQNGTEVNGKPSP